GARNPAPYAAPIGHALDADRVGIEPDRMRAIAPPIDAVDDERALAEPPGRHRAHHEIGMGAFIGKRVGLADERDTAAPRLVDTGRRGAGKPPIGAVADPREGLGCARRSAAPEPRLLHDALPP